MKTTIIATISFVFSFVFNATAQTTFSLSGVESMSIETGALPVEISTTKGTRPIVEVIVGGNVPTDLRTKLELLYAMELKQNGTSAVLIAKKQTMPALSIGGVEYPYTVRYKVLIPEGIKLVTESK